MAGRIDFELPKNKQQRMRRALKIRRATEAIERGMQKSKDSGRTKPHDIAISVLVSLEERFELRNKKLEKAPTKYIYIIAWEKYMGGYDYYAENQVEQATQDNAPEDAIYYNDGDGRWIRFEEITSDGVKTRVQQFADEIAG